MPDLSGDPIEVPGLGEIRAEAATLEESKNDATMVPLWWWLDGLLTWFMFAAFVCGGLLLLGVIA